ncbi:MAG TPA: hypothetical protein PKC30_14640 [Saprospiraceae bacterium]|nr:hypothetical protein [Saprospiraceae bacterium]
MVKCFTSITINYIPKARVLASSLKKYHPDWEFILIISDSPIDKENFVNDSFDRVIYLEELGILGLNSWVFKHSVVEICTAVKGFVLDSLYKEVDTDFVIYFDPDVVIFNSLDDLINLLNDFSFVITPHLLQPESNHGAILDNEVSALKHGVYNLGFLAVGKQDQSLEFVEWWKNRLMNYCYADIPNGLFTDQRWMDLAPAFFDKHYILRDPGYNVASWNLSQREITLNQEGDLLVNGYPLRFYHFTGYDSGAGKVMTDIYGNNNTLIKEIWDYYENELELNGQRRYGVIKWKFDFFNNGKQITKEMRKLYRERSDLQKHFPNPFNTGDDTDGGFYRWYSNV